jgi:hypothetical protein
MTEKGSRCIPQVIISRIDRDYLNSSARWLALRDL